MNTLINGAACVAIAAVVLTIGHALRGMWRRKGDELMALADATRERVAGPCGCKWFTGNGDPVYSPCRQHDYALVAAHFEAWEQEYNRQNGITP